MTKDTLAEADNYPGVAVVTGAACGTIWTCESWISDLMPLPSMGQAIAYAFAAAGFQYIALLDINEEGLKVTKSVIDHRHSKPHRRCLTKTYKDDVTNATNVAELFFPCQGGFWLHGLCRQLRRRLLRFPR
jgi:NAD(P)-dependent dehydrogenase (short-subunit alcohol dehydrogenase family)